MTNDLFKKVTVVNTENLTPSTEKVVNSLTGEIHHRPILTDPDGPHPVKIPPPNAKRLRRLATSEAFDHTESNHMTPVTVPHPIQLRKIPAKWDKHAAAWERIAKEHSDPLFCEWARNYAAFCRRMYAALISD